MSKTSSHSISTLRLGTRGSALALTQSRWVAEQLTRLHSDLTVELEVIKTQGDKITDVALSKIGGKGLFTKELENALLDGRVDIAVHSMKDLPTELAEGLLVGAVPEREDPHDVLILRMDAKITPDPNDPLSVLKDGATVGTSSLRRKAQLLHHRPDLNVIDLRGNLDTRLRKLDAGDYDAIVLALAGLRRMGWVGRATCPLPFALCLPAVGQGALAIECRADDEQTRTLLEPLDHEPTRLATQAERSLLYHLEGGCQVPIAAIAKVDDARIVLQALVASVDGTTIIRDSAESHSLTYPEGTGQELAERLRARGARGILEAIRAAGKI